MKKILLYISVLLAAVSCYKDAEYNQTLGLMMDYNVLSESGGSTQVAVFSNTSWTVQMDRQVSWASISVLEGYKSGYLVFDYDINYGRSRRLYLVFKAGDETRRMCMYQKGRISECTLTLVDSPTVIKEEDGVITMEYPFSTNFVYDPCEISLTLTYPDGQAVPDTPWITLNEVNYSKNKVRVDIAPNKTGVTRKVELAVTHTDGGVVQNGSGSKVVDQEGDPISSNKITFDQPSE